jgi:excisionase family DNA binding protein
MRDDAFHTVDEVARLCRVHPLTIRRHIAQGKLKAVRVGRRVRVKEEDLEAYIDGGTEGQWKVLTPESTLWKLIGMGASQEPTDIARHKDEYIADAIEASHDRTAE